MFLPLVGGVLFLIGSMGGPLTGGMLFAAATFVLLAGGLIVGAMRLSAGWDSHEP